MSDIVERLQAVEHADVAQKYLMIEAAQHVEKLEAEIERLRAENKALRTQYGGDGKRIAELEAGWNECREQLGRYVVAYGNLKEQSDDKD